MGFFKDLFFGTSSKTTGVVQQTASSFEIMNGVLKRYRGSDARVIVPQGVTKIGRNAFFGLLNSDGTPQLYIQEVILPDGLIEIGDGAFYDCKKLSSIIIPNTVKIISKDAFAGCMNLTNIQLPEGVEEIGNGAFARTGIGTFKFPSNLKNKTLPSKIFRACPNFTDVKIPPSFFHIGVASFAECPKLKSITIPEGVIDISGAAFSDCSGLCEVRLPRSLREIEDNAFENSYPMIIVYPESPLIDFMTRRGWNVRVTEYENDED